MFRSPQETLLSDRRDQVAFPIGLAEIVSSQRGVFRFDGDTMREWRRERRHEWSVPELDPTARRLVKPTQSGPSGHSFCFGEQAQVMPDESDAGHAVRLFAEAEKGEDVPPIFDLNGGSKDGSIEARLPGRELDRIRIRRIFVAG